MNTKLKIAVVTTIVASMLLLTGCPKSAPDLDLSADATKQRAGSG